MLALLAEHIHSVFDAFLGWRPVDQDYHIYMWIAFDKPYILLSSNNFWRDSLKPLEYSYSCIWEYSGCSESCMYVVEHKVVTLTSH